jgi:hypothetical protein
MKKQRNNKVSVGKRIPLVDNPLLVEGISRSGKFLLANILHGFQGVEHVQCYGILDHISYLENFGFIKRNAAQEMLQSEIDIHCYEMLIGRNLNFRISDKSSIFNDPRSGAYKKRCIEPDGNPVIEKYRKKNLCSMFVVHEIMYNVKMFIDTFPQLR